MKSWIWGIIMVVGNAALWGMMLVLLFVKPSTIGYISFPLMSIIMLAYIFGFAVDIKSYIDGKVEDEEEWKR